MLDKRWLKVLFCLIAFVFFTGFIYVGFFCSERFCALSPGHRSHEYDPEVVSYLRGKYERHNFAVTAVNKTFPFSTESDDVLVFLHIQKTGGTTFGRHLVKNLNLPNPCDCNPGRKRCFCMNKKDHVWLFSRYSTGWQCGLHADWTELKYCVNDYLDQTEGGSRSRRYLYITILRDPMSRFLSEWRHVERGATWKNTRLQCNGRQATLEEVPYCYKGDNWEDVSINDFMSCPSNLAYNRQARMLANLSKVGCYNQSSMPDDLRNKIMLESAVENLQDLAYFGLTEFQLYTQYLFEKTFNLAFVQDFLQFNTTHSDVVNLTQKQHDKLVKLNLLDIKLYQYAKDLFFQRLKTTLLSDSSALKQLDKVGVSLESARKMDSVKLASLVDFNPLTAGVPPSKSEIEKLQKRMQRKAKRNRKMKKRNRKKEDYYESY